MHKMTPRCSKNTPRWWIHQGVWTSWFICYQNQNWFTTKWLVPNTAVSRDFTVYSLQGSFYTLEYLAPTSVFAKQFWSAPRWWIHRGVLAGPSQLGVWMNTLFFVVIANNFEVLGPGPSSILSKRLPNPTWSVPNTVQQLGIPKTSLGTNCPVPWWGRLWSPWRPWWTCPPLPARCAAWYPGPAASFKKFANYHTFQIPIHKINWNVSLKASTLSLCLVLTIYCSRRWNIPYMEGN
jgi:hypothetical protein